MHYATALKEENRDLKDRLKYTETLLIGLQGYLLSDKFHVDTTVQAADVIRRLDEIRSSINEELEPQ